MTAFSMVMFQALSFDQKERKQKERKEHKEHNEQHHSEAKEDKRRPSELLPHLTESNGLLMQILSIELFVVGL